MTGGPGHEPAVVKCGGSLIDDVREVIDSLGGIGSFVKPGESALLKANFNTADPFPASSDSAFLAAVADLCRSAGASEVIIADSCTLALNTRRVFETTGVLGLVEGRPWLRVVSFDEGEWVKRDIPGARHIKSVTVPKLLNEVDRVIFLPCLKTHKYARYTGALKLSVGLMSRPERVLMHARRLEEKIVDLNLAVKPDLIVMDARKCFINKGPCSGEVREPGLVLASASRTAIDIEGVKVIQSYPGNSLAGIEPTNLTQIRLAIEMGL